MAVFMFCAVKGDTMAIVNVPKNLNSQLPLTCAICKVRLQLDKATAGLLNAKNEQAFACVSHFSETGKLIVGWADFTAEERKKFLRLWPGRVGLICGGYSGDA
jgi:hypothetical protein